MLPATRRFTKPASGQILILVLLIVVVSLAVGLSVASRNLTNLKTTTQTGESQRAFTAAEGGVEDVLSRLKSVSDGIVVGSSPGCIVTRGVEATCDVLVGDLTSKVNVKANPVYQSIVEEGFVGQIFLGSTTDPVPAFLSGVRVDWANKSDFSESEPASLEITVIYEPSPGNFTQQRLAFTGGSNAASGKESGFASPTYPSCESLGDFKKCTDISFNQTSPRYLRIRPFWNKAMVKVVGVGNDLKVQTYDVESKATTDAGITRKVKVTRTALPQLPAAFDYVLFSNTDIVR